MLLHNVNVEYFGSAIQINFDKYNIIKRKISFGE